MKQRNIAVGPDGFSIIEMMVTLFVLSAVLVSVFSMFAQVDYITDRAGELMTAHTVAYDKLETYENKTFANLTPGSSGANYQVEDFTSSLPSSLNTPRSAKVYVKSLSSTLKRVDVKLTYQDRKVARTINYTTMVQESGLGR